MNLNKKNFIIIAENLRIGGIQRLLLDEAYQFLEWDANPKIISLSPALPGDHIPDLDQDFSLSKKLHITYLNSEKTEQIKYFYKLIRKYDGPRIFIAHSITGAMLIRICALLSFKKVLIILQIHQLISLSDKKQQLKRLFYSMCANQIHFSSNQFLLEWEFIIRKRRFLNIIYRKKLHFDRMGVYLPRLVSPEFSKYQLCKENVPHLVYLSRVTTWKGFEKFKLIATKFASTKLHALAMTASNFRQEIFNPEEFNSDNLHVVLNSSVTSLQLNEGSIHLYPSDYGPNIRYPQSIGMNVLEMISQGIPSLISGEGFESWPELCESELVKVVDWSDDEEISRTIEASTKLSSQIRRSESQRLSAAISIEDHCHRLANLMTAFPQ